MEVGIIGAAGYAGAELVRLLAGHPEVTKLILGSVSHGGERIEEIYPNFLGKVSAAFEKPEELIPRSAVVFAALPHGVGEPYARLCVEKGIPYIDLSADFRFGDDEAVFSAWYGKPFVYPELRKYSVYGLPELNREKIRALAEQGPVIIGNPGCYPTAAFLGAFPALAGDWAGQGTIIVDAASGVSGGGRDPVRAFHYPECADSISPYKVGAHRHTPEIRRNLEAIPGRKVLPQVIFTPHLAPMNRGILCTTYIPLVEDRRPPGAGRDPSRPPGEAVGEKVRELREFYAGFYRKEPFVRVLPPGLAASTGRLRQSNFCDISVHLDPAGTTLILVSAIDNMVKGAAGQAVQNMNIIFGFAETAGLEAIPASF